MTNKENNSNMYKTSGYVSEIRNFGNLLFLIIRKGYKSEQITFFKKDCPELHSKAKDITKESYIEVIGTKKDAEKAVNGYEVVPKQFKIITKAKAPVPLDISGKIESGFDSRIDHRFLDLRMPKHKAIFKIRSKVYKAVVDYFHSKDFVNINTPKLTEGGVESGAELFTLDYFGKPAYLSQSPQVYKQMMVLADFDKVYEIAPVFRAEKSNTSRHTSEFTGIDFEIADIKGMDQIMGVVEGLIKHILKYVKENCKEDFNILGKDIEDLKVPKEIPKIDMKTLKKYLKEEGKDLSPEDDLDSESEKLVNKICKKKFNSEIVFVTKYPFASRPFYHMCYKEKENGLKITKSFDLIWKGLEMCTGAQREHRVEILEKQIKEKNMPLDKMDYYTNLFRYGAPAHGGTGLGLDRILEALLDLSNIKEGIFLPRDPDRLTP